MILIKKILSFSLVLILVSGLNIGSVRAYDVPDAPLPTSTSPPEPPDAPESPDTPGPADSSPDTVVNQTTDAEDHTSPGTGTQSDGTEDHDTGNQTQSSDRGQATIVTGDSAITGSISTGANDNTTADGIQNNGSSQFVSGSGSGSVHDTAVSDVSVGNTRQENSSRTDSALTLSSVTGNNTSGFNTGADTTIISGDANASGTIINSSNTNTQGVTISEFNVMDDHQGDYILDFNANCLSGCPAGSTISGSIGNGSDSLNTSNISSDTHHSLVQTNDAKSDTVMFLSADTGGNSSSFNTGGDTLIMTGDANVSASSLTFINNNVSGKVIYSTVNIYDDLIGDIIFPEDAFALCCTTGINVNASANGSLNDNSVAVSDASTNAARQSNDATIVNNLVLATETGENQADFNSAGNVTVKTGSTNVVTGIVNVANSNIEGNVWLVLINAAGEWIGRIIGGTGTLNSAVSDNMAISAGNNGQLEVTNEGNGTETVHSQTAISQADNSTGQSNSAQVTNTLNLSANTGNNSANYNTGGNTSIVTGDANIIANAVNFLNNNITGTGRLFVTVVNVFGSWVGNFLTPGAHKVLNVNIPAGGPGGDVPGERSVTETISEHVTTGSSGKTTGQASGGSRTTNNTVYNYRNGPGYDDLFNNVSKNIQSYSDVLTGNTAYSSDKMKNGTTDYASYAVTIPPAGDGETGHKIKINLSYLLLLLPLGAGIGILRNILPALLKLFSTL